MRAEQTRREQYTDKEISQCSPLQFASLTCQCSCWSFPLSEGPWGPQRRRAVPADTDPCARVVLHTVQAFLANMEGLKPGRPSLGCMTNPKPRSLPTRGVSQQHRLAQHTHEPSLFESFRPMVPLRWNLSEMRCNGLARKAADTHVTHLSKMCVPFREI